MAPFSDLIKKHYPILMIKWSSPRRDRAIWVKVVGHAMFKERFPDGLGQPLNPDAVSFYAQCRQQAEDAYDAEVN